MRKDIASLSKQMQKLFYRIRLEVKSAFSHFPIEGFKVKIN